MTALVLHYDQSVTSMCEATGTHLSSGVCVVYMCACTCVCVCVCVYDFFHASMYVCIYVCMYICMYAYIPWVGTYVYTHTHTHTHTHAYVHTYRPATPRRRNAAPPRALCSSKVPTQGTFAYIHTYMHTYVRVHTHTYAYVHNIHTYIHTCIHTYVYTHTYAYVHNYRPAIPRRRNAAPPRPSAASKCLPKEHRHTIHIYIHIHTNTHTHTLADIHTYMHTRRPSVPRRRNAAPPRPLCSLKVPTQGTHGSASVAIILQAAQSILRRLLHREAAPVPLAHTHSRPHQAHYADQRGRQPALCRLFAGFTAEISAYGCRSGFSRVFGGGQGVV